MASGCQAVFFKLHPIFPSHYIYSLSVSVRTEPKQKGKEISTGIGGGVCDTHTHTLNKDSAVLDLFISLKAAPPLRR